MAPPQGETRRSRRRSSRHLSKNYDRDSASDRRGYHGNLRQGDIGKTPIAVVPVPKEKLHADGEPVEIGGKSKNKGKKSNGKTEGVEEQERQGRVAFRLGGLAHEGASVGMPRRAGALEHWFEVLGQEV